jgi:hypothetical protein
MRLSGRPAVPALALLLVLWSAPLAAISVFDVIRLSQARYPDDEIIRLIQTTDSRFLLTAEDTVRLREAGVTEPVIREMLSRPATPRDSEPTPSASASGSRAEPLFAASPYPGGNADRQAHAAVTLAGIEVLILRDRDGFSSHLARARAVSRILNSPAAPASGRFVASASGQDARVTLEGSDRAATDVITVTPADAAAYRGAGLSPVSPATLASFWAALLNDYWAIGVAGRPPRYLLDSPGGQSLERLSAAARAPAGPRGAASLRAALESLGKTDREHLRRLPLAVPEDLDLPVRRTP